ncbi:hypothetical protein NLX86_27050 [Streptomyces sp. A3M-1-3]|uniref:hypothetical protein n=1 Tax=Streptomyces sp. A3M-1-3 TaxID=2962044 RepID=UPI0020B69CA5|nr:hypothetical protein [Streptomyces sp. A3M-1-3]MCP3821616.1 hypothetical protein [Streptomyces sp. A3M-1-3]
MSPRALPPLRTWSGALLVCALFVCLSGLARPAMAMAMPGPMDVAPPVASGAHAEHAAASAMAEEPDHSPHCPATHEQCVAPKATLAQDVPSGHVLAGASRATVCIPTLPVAQPNAPPPMAAPPDLHRLCVSRT